MSLILPDPAQTVQECLDFIRQTFKQAGKEWAIVAVSGGIDSALSLTLCTQALGPTKVRPILMPYLNQPMEDAELMCEWNQINQSQWQVVQIAPLVQAASQMVDLDPGQPPVQDQVRLGNLMARSRMMVVFDQAKKWQGLVCGTENKSEHFLGYFTRFGDAASDLEPISHLYKTQVRQVSQFLGLPTAVLTKSPSAGLWQHQTDETELGFSYQLADEVLDQFIDQGRSPTEISVAGATHDQVQAVIDQVQAMAFKLRVPYEVKADS